MWRVVLGECDYFCKSFLSQILSVFCFFFLYRQCNTKAYQCGEFTNALKEVLEDSGHKASLEDVVLCATACTKYLLWEAVDVLWELAQHGVRLWSMVSRHMCVCAMVPFRCRSVHRQARCC